MTGWHCYKTRMDGLTSDGMFCSTFQMIRFLVEIPIRQKVAYSHCTRRKLVENDMRWIVGKHSLPDDMNQSCAEGQNQVTTFRMILYCLQHGFKKGWKLDIRFESWTGYAFQTFLYYLLTDEDDF